MTSRSSVGSDSRNWIPPYPRLLVSLLSKGTGVGHRRRLPASPKPAPQVSYAGVVPQGQGHQALRLRRGTAALQRQVKGGLKQFARGPRAGGVPIIGVFRHFDSDQVGAH